MWSSGAGDDGHPVWVTVLVARLAGGVIGGSVSYALLHGSSALGALAPAVVGAAVTGGAITLFLPAISRRTIGGGTALGAALLGAALPVVGTLVLTHGSFRTSAGGTLVFSGAGALVTLASTVLGIAVTSWLVSATSLAPTGWREAPTSPLHQVERDDQADAPSPPRAEEPLETGYWAAMEERRTGN
jgi:hypothetical protein